MNERPDPSAGAGSCRRRWQLGLVLLASLLLLVAQPLTAGLVAEQGCFGFFFSVLIAAVLLMVFEEREHRRIAGSLGVAAFLTVWLSVVLGGDVGRMVLVAAYLLAACFFAFALYGILRRILVRQATGHAIFGAVCGYLLLGIIWSLLYYAVETASPGSFRLPESPAVDVTTAQRDRNLLNYYSFITLATVGYGDVTPTTQLTRTLAWMEAIAGQLYLAILVAGLVGFEVTQALKT